MNAPKQIIIDQRRKAKPLSKCPNCGGKPIMAQFGHLDKKTVVIIAGCECGQRFRVYRSSPRRF